MTTYRLTIPKRHLYEGLSAILGMGHGTFTDRDNVFLVQDEALRALDDAGIPYRAFDGRKTVVRRTIR